MLTRRGLAQCLLCAIASQSGFAATAAQAEAPAAPAGVRRTILRRGEGPTPEFETVLAEALVDANAMVPRHIHPGVESGYIVEGSAVLELEGAPPLPVKAGDGVIIAARRPHLLRNGDRPMKIISTYILEKGQPIALPA
ncbi:quercetin dioxygenase-like cupin family protein [Rhodoblastus acidophilus]|uniref:cupin domain-containing protein n=1 Tax=Rhodoblastus acidophilus TaxID=1074 RepID=UPI0016151DE4|nr:cupin domain-containing protein [Rhodoblastus acidophilus]MCW2283865.1 quercetin dioxygenase-like cupin family protein [Rhodoblastus acidophilus]MCW2332561.1 quercetin dioxygenase-like cupin family protein [Rhodoblastus acidophilus]